NRVERPEGRAALQRQVLGDRRRQRRLAVVNVADRPDVYMRLRPLKYFLTHVPARPPRTARARSPQVNRALAPVQSKRVNDKMEPPMGFDPMTSFLPRTRSTPELRGHQAGC